MYDYLLSKYKIRELIEKQIDKRTIQFSFKFDNKIIIHWYKLNERVLSFGSRRNRSAWTKKIVYQKDQIGSESFLTVKIFGKANINIVTSQLNGRKEDKSIKIKIQRLKRRKKKKKKRNDRSK